jgi:surface polysaccharide O-acyltransferase-like enzyme
MEESIQLKHRISGIDCFRVIAIFAVILINSKPLSTYSGETEIYLDILIHNTSRFAVPFFFIVAGYFWGKKVDEKNLSHVFRSYSRRIVSVFLFWCVIYIFAPTNIPALLEYGFLGILKIPYWKISYYINDPITFLLKGSSGHLWFLLSLFYATVIVTFLIRIRMDFLILPIGALFYIFGLLIGPYSLSPLGLAVNFNSAVGPLFSTIMFGAGYKLSRTRKILSSKLAYVLIIGGYLLHMSEAFYIWNKWELSPNHYSYYLGTIPYGLGITILALTFPRFGVNTRLARIGIYTLGIYCSHVLYVDLLNPVVIYLQNQLVDLLYPVLVFYLSLITVKLIARDSITRKFVV